jgi:hypothetical protein
MGYLAKLRTFQIDDREDNRSRHWNVRAVQLGIRPNSPHSDGHQYVAMKINSQTRETVVREGQLDHDKAVTEPSSSEGMVHY